MGNSTHSLSSTQFSQSTLETTIGVSFRDQNLLYIALTHSSYLNEYTETSIESNERLEFLGDALIGTIIAHEIYSRHPNWSEGTLTKARARIVQGETLAIISDRISLGKYLVMGRGEEETGGRNKTGNLAGALEALVGAIFIDQGYKKTCEFVLRVMSKELSLLKSNGPIQNAKSTLQEITLMKGYAPPTYQVVEVTGPPHSPRFTVEVSFAESIEGRGTGSRKTEAEQAAAANALKSMDIDLTTS